jgi:hypothetical protein
MVELTPLVAQAELAAPVDTAASAAWAQTAAAEVLEPHWDLAVAAAAQVAPVAQAQQVVPVVQVARVPRLH